MSARGYKPAIVKAGPAAPAATQQLWSLLTSDPTTGVLLLGAADRILYSNKQALRIFIGNEAASGDFVGRELNALLPDEVAAARKRVLADVRASGEPVMLRVIWNGFQHVTWLQALPARAGGAARGPGCHILVVTRRVEGDPLKDGRILSPRVRVVESEHVRLGPLAVLSARELEVLALIGQGMSSNEIALVLHRSVKTLEKHRESLGKKLAVQDRVTLAAIAQRAGLTLRDVARKRV